MVEKLNIIDSFSGPFKNRVPFLRQNYNLNKQAFAFFLTNDCRVDTNDLLPCFFIFLNIEFMSLALQFLVVFYFCMHNLHTKQYVEPHIYCIFILPQHIW